MKTIKWLTPVLTTSLVAASGSIGLISCSNNEVPSEIEKFISDRTFSILGVAEIIDDPGYVSTVLGTCWVIDDATCSVANDYCYYVATNWHVTHGNDSLLNNPDEYQNFKYKYGDSSLTNRSDRIIDFRTYKDFKSCERQLDTSFTYSSPTPTTYFKPCIDLHVYKVDFGSPTGKIKTKLDGLNELKQSTGKINTFVNGDDTDIMLKNKYVAGYPAKESSKCYGGKWEARKLPFDSLIYCEKGSVSWSGYGGPGHAIGTPDINQKGVHISYPEGTESEPFYYYDISPQYECLDDKGTDWMTGGASGSMLLTEDLEICGIYWGGSSTASSFYPFFSLFKTEDKDFISHWLNK